MFQATPKYIIKKWSEHECFVYYKQNKIKIRYLSVNDKMIRWDKVNKITVMFKVPKSYIRNGDEIIRPGVTYEIV